MCPGPYGNTNPVSTGSLATLQINPMKVLFIHEYLPQEMLGIMWLSRQLKDAGHETSVLFIPDSKGLEQAVAYNPDIVAYSTTTGMHLYIAEVSRSVKKVLPNALSVVGGPHPSFSPEFVEEEGIDAICRGEGEHAFLELVEQIREVLSRAQLRKWRTPPSGSVHDKSLA